MVKSHLIENIPILFDCWSYCYWISEVFEQALHKGYFIKVYNEYGILKTNIDFGQPKGRY